MKRFELTVDRKAFSKALKTATTGIRSKSVFQIRLHFGDGLMFVSGPGASSSLDAKGQWPGAVLIDGSRAKALATRLPELNPFTLVVEDRLLKMGGFSMAVEAMDLAPAMTDIVLGAGSHSVLQAVERHGAPAVVSSIGDAAIEKARREAYQSVNMAYSHLKAFGVLREEVEACLEQSIRRQVVPGRNQS